MRKPLRPMMIVLILGIIAASSCHFLMRDDPPPNDDDLQVTRSAVPGEDNAFTYFDQAGQAAYWPEERGEELQSILAGEVWNADLVSEVLDRNQEGLEYFEQGMGRSQFQVPEVKALDAPLPYVDGWKNISRVLSVRASVSFKCAKDREALSEAMKLVKFGHMIEGSGGVLVVYLVGAGAKEMGLVRLRGMVGDTGLRPAVLKGHIEPLEAYGANEKGLINTYRAEYVSVAGTIDGVSARTLFGAYLSHPNKCKSMYAQTFRIFIENVPKSYVDMEHIEKPDFRRRSSGLRLILTGETVWGMVHGLELLPLQTTQLRKCKQNVSVATTRLLLALKCYKLEKGELPESLEELVPEYIEEVPLDDFDGRPMRYSREKKIIYSVGEDLKDSGGSEEPEGRDEKEPTFGIEF